MIPVKLQTQYTLSLSLDALSHVKSDLLNIQKS